MSGGPNPTIVFVTDFGLTGPYVGQMEAVIVSISPRARLINLLADAPVHNPRATAYLLAAYQQHFKAGTIFLCVVDPGVGTQQSLPVIVSAQDKWFVGPDNGLFDALFAQFPDCRAWRLDWRPARLSASFHGRDLYAPVAGRLAIGEWLAASEFQVADRACQSDLEEVVYIDHFGNVMMGLRTTQIAAASTLSIAGRSVHAAQTYARVAVGELFWYENSNGLVEIAANQRRANEELGVAIGDAVEIKV